MAALRLLQPLGWPVAAGLLIALLALLIFPGLRPAPTLGTHQQQPSADQPQALHSYADAVDRAAPAVVNIYTRKALEQRRHPLADHPLYRHLQRHLEQPQQRQQSALGSGVIVDTRGYLLTNEHVIRGAEDILVLLHDGRETRAQLVGTDPESDLAVLKIDLDQLTAIAVGEPNKVRVGDIVLAIGNPFGVGQTVTQGIISATGRWNLNISEYENFLQTDAAINVGNSGGALVDTKGRLLGINTAILRESEFLGQSEFSVGVSFAIPADSAMNSLREIIEHGRVVRGWLGLEAQPLTPQMAREFSAESGHEGVLVTAIYADSPAHLAGLNPGDILTHINNQSVGEDGRRGMNQIAATEPGSEVTLRILRDGRRLQLETVIGERPSTSG